jgi:hypothetical protein
VWKAVCRRWPEAEYAALVEFTTGYGPRAGGRRRPHWNVFVRGVPVDQAAELQAVAARVWCSRIDALAEQQRVTLVAEDRGGMRGLTRYVSLHFLKESQAPPKGWRGQRFRASRGYFVRSRAELRSEAQRALRVKRLIRRGVPAELAELELAAAELVEWELRHVTPATAERGPRLAASGLLGERSHDAIVMARMEEDLGRWLADGGLGAARDQARGPT